MSPRETSPRETSPRATVSAPYSFREARPVWVKGEERTKNMTVDFTAVLPKTSARLSLAANCSFVIVVNGNFLAHGPARTAHGYYRVDEYDLTPLLTADENLLAIRVAGYNVCSFATLDMPSFLCAEVVAGDKVLFATAETGAEKGFAPFTASVLSERVQKVQRFSYQRPFVEAYRLDENAFAAEKVLPEVAAQRAEQRAEQLSEQLAEQLSEQLAEQRDGKIFIGRDIPYGEYPSLFPKEIVARGILGKSQKEKYYDSREISDIGPLLGGFKADELELPTQIEYGRRDFLDRRAPEAGDVIGQNGSLDLPANTFVDLSFERNFCGIPEIEFESEGGKLFLSFDELLGNGDKPGLEIDCFRMGTSALIEVISKPGTYKLICAEPYVMKYLRLSASGGAVKVRSLRLIKVAFPASEITATFREDPNKPGSADMRRIYDAAVETFAANAVDIYMDCPSRERAGWLCDSFFTARVEYALTGKSRLERAFLENFLLPEKFPRLCEGMLPMCYPSDHFNGEFIPNWAMWYGLELEEYVLKRGGDRKLSDIAKERLYGLLNYFRAFENGDGLLEKLKSWVFVEWSHANELVRDLNFPTNMLYARFKDALANLYGDESLHAEADALRARIRALSMTESGFFCDNMVYGDDGKLALSGERTECCQYYAFYFGIASPETDPDLWNTLLDRFGWDRDDKVVYPEIWRANAFIGNYLRLDLLARYGLYDRLRENILGYFTYMADRTGTLWEHANSSASCNHGFASHVIQWMKQMEIVG